MDTEKTNTPPTAEAVTDEEKDFYNGLIYELYNEYVEELGKQTEAECAEEREVLAHFAELEGVQEKNPYTMLFAGFRAGVAKGLELAARMESNT